VGRRLDGLAPGARSLVAVAAVLGREVDGELLVAVAAVDAAEALVAMKELLARQVLEEVRPGRFRFVHDKLRETAYERLIDGEPRRREMHRQAAATIEQRYAGASGFEHRYSELAHHFTEAGDLGKAIDYLEKAGEQAQRNFANREAVRFLGDALALDEKAGFASDVVRRAAWERQLGNAFLGLGKLVESQQHLHAAVALLGSPMPASRARLVGGFVSQALVQLAHRLVPTRIASEERARAVLIEAARAYDLLMPVSYFVTGELPRILYATLRNLNLSERAGPSPELALAYANAHVTTGLIPWFSLAESYGRRARQVLEGVSDPAVRSWVYVLLGSNAIGVAAWPVAFEAGQAALAIAEEVGFRRRMEEALGVLGTAHFLHGDFASARDISQRTWDSAMRGDPQTQVWGASGVAQACICLGEIDRAVAATDAGVRCLAQNLGRPEKIIAYGVAALARLRAGDHERARELAVLGAEAISQGTPIAFYCIGAYSFVAEVFLDLWERERGGGREALARLARRSVKEVARSAKVFPVHRPRAHWLWGRVEQQCGRPARARRRFEKSLEAARALDEPYDASLASQSLAALGAG
jgi:tetratricopeptide (TPR) repeat protein